MKTIRKRLTAAVMSLVLCFSLCHVFTGAAAAIEPEKPKLIFAAGIPQEGNGYRWDGSVLTLYGVNWGSSADTEDEKYDSVTLPAGARVETWGANAVNTALCCLGDLTLSGTGLLHITGTVLCAGRLTAESGELELEGNAAESPVRAAALTVTGGAVSVSDVRPGSAPYGPGITGPDGSLLVYTQSGGCVTVITTGTGIAAGTLTLTGGYLDLTAEGSDPGITGSLTNRGGVVCVRSGGTAIRGNVTADSGVIYAHSETAAVDGSVTGQEDCWKLLDNPEKVAAADLSSCSELIIAREVYAGPVPAETMELDSAFVRNTDDAAAWEVTGDAAVKGGCLLMSIPVEAVNALTVSAGSTLTLKGATLVSDANGNAGAVLNGGLAAEGASTLIGIGRGGYGIRCGGGADFRNGSALNLIGIGGDVMGDSVPSDSPDVSFGGSVGTGILFDGAAHVQGSTLVGLGRDTGIHVLTTGGFGDSLLLNADITAVGGGCGLTNAKENTAKAVFQNCRISGTATDTGSGCRIGSTSVLTHCTMGAYGSAGAFYVDTVFDNSATDCLFMPELSGDEVSGSNIVWTKDPFYQAGWLTPAADCPIAAIGCCGTGGGYDAALSLDAPYYHNGAEGVLGEVNTDETGANAVLSLAEDGGYLLTLNGLDLRPAPSLSDSDLSSVYGIYVCAGAPLTVQIKGSNVIGEMTDREGQVMCGLDQGIYSDADLTFTGGGTLNIADNCQGIASAYGNIVFDTENSFSLTVADMGTSRDSMRTLSCCLAADEGDITLGQGSYTLTSEYSAGISAGGGVTVQGSAAVNVSGGPVGICAEGGALVIRGLPGGGQAAVSSRADEYTVFARDGIRTDVNSITGALEAPVIRQGILTDNEGDMLPGLTQADKETPLLFRNETISFGGGEASTPVKLPITAMNTKGEAVGNDALTGTLKDGVVKIDDSEANRKTMEKLALQEETSSIDITVKGNRPGTGNGNQPGKSGIIGAQIPSDVTDNIMKRNTKVSVGINYSADSANSTVTAAVTLPAGVSGSVILKHTSDVAVPVGMKVMTVADIKAENLPENEAAEIRFSSGLNVIWENVNTPEQGAVYHQERQGNWTALPTTYTVDAGSNTVTYIAQTTSFSNFALAFPTDGGVSACPKDSTCPMEPFTDAPNDSWYHDGVHYCLGRGIMKGISGTAFNPNGEITRAMLVTMLYRLDGSPTVNGVCPFDDVTEDDWFAYAVLWANLCGVVKGVSETEFAPNASLTREQMATMLYRYAQYKDLDTESVGKDTTPPDFDDIAAVSDWAAEAMHWAVSAGLINGMTETALEPQGTATRAQSATILMRLCTKILAAQAGN